MQDETFSDVGQLFSRRFPRISGSQRLLQKQSILATILLYRLEDI